MGMLSVGSKDSKADKDPIFTKEWCSENRRLLHQQRQRAWLRSKAKHRFIDFDDTERSELQRYFDALSGGSDIIIMESMENMLISLGLANTRQEVQVMVSKIDSNGNGELDFEEYLQVLMGGKDTEIFNVFKSMMDGKLGDRRINFLNVISTFRRQQIMDATGARSQREGSQASGVRILGNFAKLERLRYEDKLLQAEANPGSPKPDELPFDMSVRPPLGGLEMLWRAVKAEHSLVPEVSADKESMTAVLGTPPSPRTLIQQVTKNHGNRPKITSYNKTIMLTQASAGDW